MVFPPSFVPLYDISSHPHFNTMVFRLQKFEFYSILFLISICAILTIY